MHRVEEGQVSFYALRDIEKDEELTFSYIDDDIPLQQRRELIFSSWDFHCRCSRCQSEMRDENNDAAPGGGVKRAR
eukprot:Skav212539  [mRNA]  locus=scaffold1851:328386:328613:+ [translate_table: standard]